MPLGILLIVFLFSSSGKALVDLCQAWKGAEQDITECIVNFETTWFKFSSQCAFILSIAKILEQEHSILFYNQCIVLTQKLSIALTTIQKVAPPTGEIREGIWAFGQAVNKFTYIRIRSTLRTVVQDFEQWQKRFDPSWLLLMRIAKPIIDEQLKIAAGQGNRTEPSFGTAPFAVAQNVRVALRPGSERQSSIFVPVIDMQHEFPVAYCTARVARPRAARADWYIIDPVMCPRGRDVNAINQDVRRLAHKLRQSDPSAFGLLSCRGVMRRRDPATQEIVRFDMVFRKPDGLDSPQSLRQMLLQHASGDGMSISINRRLQMARELARSISYVHALGLVHKNIRPESILVFDDTLSRYSTFLVGFDGFRAADGVSAMQGDTEWHKNLYRHPTRQGEFPLEYYKMQHDIFSLGICLLEIGLWQPFVSYSESLDPEVGPGLNRETLSHEAGQIKEFFTDLAQRRLPNAMGDRYTQAVATCLKCLDPVESEGVERDFDVDDKDGILVSVRFIEKVLGQLDDIII